MYKCRRDADSFKWKLVDYLYILYKISLKVIIPNDFDILYNSYMSCKLFENSCTQSKCQDTGLIILYTFRTLHTLNPFL